MSKNRLEAFSDGVVAIILTIMVLELKIPHTTNWSEIFSLYPYFISYSLSFLFIAIYWVNHHHLIHTLKKVNSNILWSNIALLDKSGNNFSQNNLQPFFTNLILLNVNSKVQL